MASIRIRVNEAELMKVWPRDAVVALRQIITVVSSGIEVGNIGDLETLILTTESGRAASDAVAQQLQHLRHELNAIRQRMPDANQFQQALATLQVLIQRPAAQHQQPQTPERTTNLSAIERRVSDLENLIAGGR